MNQKSIIKKSELQRVRDYLRIYGNTIIRWSIVEKYGVEAVRARFAEAGIDCVVTIIPATPRKYWNAHLKQWVDEGHPTVLIETPEKHGNK